MEEETLSHEDSGSDEEELDCDDQQSGLPEYPTIKLGDFGITCDWA
jgi:hypothetical protein